MGQFGVLLARRRRLQCLGGPLDMRARDRVEKLDATPLLIGLLGLVLHERSLGD